MLLIGPGNLFRLWRTYEKQVPRFGRNDAVLRRFSI